MFTNLFSVLAFKDVSVCSMIMPRQAGVKKWQTESFSGLCAAQGHVYYGIMKCKSGKNDGRGGKFGGLGER